ncbi:MAG: polymerase subunit sigma [Proteobacteria bacterium]|nr:polymerase subunit sigma [Pseudomonadota bacterium]
MRTILIHVIKSVSTMTACNKKATVSATTASIADFAHQRQIERLYSEHHGWLRSWLRKKLGNAFDAADLAHDTYLRIMATERVPEPDESRRHLSQIANGLIIDLYRRRQIEAAYLDSLAQLPEQQAPSEEARALVIEALVEIDAILHGIAPKARKALLMCRLDGLSYREIADQLEVSVSSVEKYIAAGLLACHRALHAQNA